ncbi:TIGR00730 family Rossman fold protein [Ferruginibacter sp. SUN106]|uniref:LOG family protein n=1 Tax=Ferruginibacter sp. SUN106 TaxID=2978348 RepID=UPI003D35F641
MAITSVAVFCGSKSGNNPLFENHATQLGHILAEKNIRLIYGGGNKGIMGAVANAVLEKEGKVTGIIPQLLTDREHSHQGITELIVVEDMHVRKKMLYEKCDAAIILAGGFGTLDELFEMLTWNQLSIHSKEIFILNTAGFYDHLIAHAKTMQQENFLYDAIEDRITIITVPDEIKTFL